MGVLLLDSVQLNHNDDEDHQTQKKDQEEVGDHAHVEGSIIIQPAATRQQHRKVKCRKTFELLYFVDETHFIFGKLFYFIFLCQCIQLGILLEKTFMLIYNIWVVELIFFSVYVFSGQGLRINQ